MPSFGTLFSTTEPSTLLLTVAVAYLLGAIPLADRISRRRGVNIFRSGTGLAGSSNVIKSVGRVPGAIVFIGDMSKGILVIVVAGALGIDGVWTVVPAAAAVIGHWNSVFTRFKGGDGLATLGGVTLAVFPLYGLVGVFCAGAVALGGQRMPYTSLLSVISGYAVIVALSLHNLSDVRLPFAYGALATIVFAHAILGHALRRRTTVDAGLASAEQLAE
jgi:glycerol-3-phosphate acyltransferase PlsY